jgi:hypothetical protein
LARFRAQRASPPYRMFNSAYEQSLSLQRKTTEGMTTLYEDVSS